MKIDLTREQVLHLASGCVETHCVHRDAIELACRAALEQEQAGPDVVPDPCADAPRISEPIHTLAEAVEAAMAGMRVSHELYGEAIWKLGELVWKAGAGDAEVVIRAEVLTGWRIEESIFVVVPDVVNATLGTSEFAHFTNKGQVKPDERSPGKPISRAEALHLCVKVLLRAEEERRPPEPEPETEVVKRVKALEKALAWAMGKMPWKYWSVEKSRLCCRYCTGQSERWGVDIQHAPDCPAGEALKLVKEANHV